MEGRHWRTSLRARAAVIGITAAGLALYALLGGAGRSVVPFQGRSVSTVASDVFSTSIDDTYCEASDVPNVAAMGPAHSAYYYWNSNGTWQGPLQISPAGTVFSAPANAVNDYPDGTGAQDDNVVFEGPGHSLYFVWQIGASWYGPLQIGAPGSTYSKPTIVLDKKGDVDIAAQGPNGSLFFYWGIGGTWYGPLQIAGPGQAFSAPSASDDTYINCDSVGQSQNESLGVAALGPSGQSVVYWDRNGTWLAPVTSGTNQEYSSPSTASSSNEWGSAYVGPSHSLIGQASYGDGGTNSYCVIGPAGSAYSAPTTSSPGDAVSYNNTNDTSTFNYSVDGPSRSLYAFWATGPSAPTSCSGFSFYGPLQLNGAGTTFSVPAGDDIGDSAGNANENIVVEGPSHTLWDYYSVNGTWYGPLQLGAPGTTYDSNS